MKLDGINASPRPRSKQLRFSPDKREIKINKLAIERIESEITKIKNKGNVNELLPLLIEENLLAAKTLVESEESDSFEVKKQMRKTKTVKILKSNEQ